MANQDPPTQDASGWMDALDGENAQSKGFEDAHADLIQDRPADMPKDGPASLGDINMVMEIPVQISVELGRTRVPIKYILQLAQGSVVELDALAGAPMDVLVNGYLIAQGEVVVVNEKFGIRLTDVVTPAERLRRASRQHGS
jgi:flagellar motor switch protein FliN/FliY